MATKLVQLGLPPLSQSRQALMACPRFYVESEVHRNRKPRSQWAERGTEVHRVIAAYVAHCLEKKVPADWPAFDELSEAVGVESKEILESFRKDFELDPHRALGSELYIALDDNFMPLEQNWTDQKPSEFAAQRAYEMTLDYVELPRPDKAILYDWKSYYQVVSAETFQGKLYSLGLFCLNANIQEVEFRLEFVRWGVSREVVYTRGDVPRLAKEVRAERERQHSYHQEPEAHLDAFPGRHCNWCPLLSNGCPIAGKNPYEMAPAERLAYAVYLRRALTDTMDVLKAQVAESEIPLETTDPNGNTIRAEFRLKQRKRYPLEPAAMALLEWKQGTGDDLAGRGYVSGLSSFLKAKKRARLAEQMDGIAEVTPQTDFKISVADDEDEANGE